MAKWYLKLLDAYNTDILTYQDEIRKIQKAVPSYVKLVINTRWRYNSPLLTDQTSAINNINGIYMVAKPPCSI